MEIGSFVVGNPNQTFVVAEIGINHNGDIELAKKMIRDSKDAGADAVKFQKRTVPIVYNEIELAKARDVPAFVLEKALQRGVLPAENMERLRSKGFESSTNGDLKWALEFTEDEYREIDEFCKELGIVWFASPWDEESVDFLEKFDVPCHKVASASMTDDGLLKHMRATGKPVILSTGMADLEMIRHAVNLLDTKSLIILHCTSVYPTMAQGDFDRGLSLINLRALETLRSTFPGVPIGFSSNDFGIQPTYAAVVLGACMIEKHVTTWQHLWGSDQASSIEFADFKRLVRMIREFPVALGTGEIEFYEEERPVAAKLRRKG